MGRYARQVGAAREDKMPKGADIVNVSAKVALILACTTVAINASLDICERLHAPAATKPAAVVPFRHGAKAPAVPGVDFAASTRTLLLFVSTNCGHCAKSAPFYDKLAKAASAGPGQGELRVIAVFPQPDDDVNAFKARTKLDIESIADVPLGTVGVTLTPTVVLVSQNGLVTGAWLGSEGKQNQDAIYSAFFGGR